MYEERRVVETSPAQTVPADTEVVRTEPATVVERRPTQRRVVADDPLGTSMAAGQMIQTIVWAIVVLGVLIVALWALHVYAGLF